MLADNLDVRTLEENDYPKMYTAFINAFSDYSIPFKLSETNFRKRFIDKLHMNFSLSAGCFHNSSLVGFIFTSVDRYEGLLTAYNGGTGVIPEYRGKGITIELYNYLIPLFKKKDITQCVLEVLTENKTAIRIYEKLGFKISRNYKGYKLNPSLQVSDKENKSIRIYRVESPDWKIYTKFYDYIPSYLDSKELIESNLKNEIIIEAELEGQTVGYAIFQPFLGRISQIGVHRDFRVKGIGSMLLRYVHKNSDIQNLSIINVLEGAEAMQNFLERSGFENEFNQYEMRLKL